ncbi:hypothetical protein Ahia01_000684600 [Argonauta hians]
MSVFSDSKTFMSLSTVLIVVVCTMFLKSYSYNSRGYMVSELNSTWCDARSICQQFPKGDLADFKSFSDIKGIGIQARNRSFWMRFNSSKIESSSKEKCESVMLQEPFTREHVFCNTKLPFICETQFDLPKHDSSTSIFQTPSSSMEYSTGNNVVSQTQSSSMEYPSKSNVESWTAASSMEYSVNTNVEFQTPYSSMEYSTDNNVGSQTQSSSMEYPSKSNVEFWTAASSMEYSVNTNVEFQTPSSSTEYSTDSNAGLQTPSSSMEYPSKSNDESWTTHSSKEYSTDTNVGSTVVSSGIQDIPEVISSDMRLWSSGSADIQTSSQVFHCKEVCVDRAGKTIMPSPSSIGISTVTMSSTLSFMETITWIPPNKNITFERQLNEMKNMNKKIKDKVKELKKISVEDNRASSISLGTIGILIIVFILSLIVIPDLLTLKYYYYKRIKKRNGVNSPVKKPVSSSNSANNGETSSPVLPFDSHSLAVESIDNHETDELEIHTKF